jgi:hypothetical protein
MHRDLAKREGVWHRDLTFERSRELTGTIAWPG